MKNNILVSFEDIDEPLYLSTVESFLQKVLEERNHSGWEISILFCSDEMMQNLNKSYRNIDAPTDVLSFEAGEEYTTEDGDLFYAAGDIAICPFVMGKNAKEFGVSIDEELKRLLIHGCLHLEGMDHGDAHITAGAHITDDTTGNDTGDAMLEIQEKLLNYFTSFVIIEE